MLPRRSSAAALVLAAGLAVTACGGGGDSPSPAPPPRPAQPPAAKLAPPPVVPPVAATEYTYETKNRRDPFRPLITPKPPATAAKAKPKTGMGSLEVHELKLAGVVWEARGYYALVEAPSGAGYVIRVNDVIGDEARVAKISPEGITLEVKAAAPAGPVRQESRLVQIRLRKEE